MQTISSLLAILLSPLSAIYWLVTSLRNWFYDIGALKSTSFDIPILSVGNLTVGGTGKTPMVEYLINELKEDYTIAILSRGYGRKTKGFLWVQSHYMPSQTGDEPLQIKVNYEDVLVAVCEDRVAGVQRIISEYARVNLIILDDAFQHRAIKPSTQLLLSTHSRPFYKDWVMPSGRLRESRRGAARADAILYTKCPEDFVPREWNDIPVFHSGIVYPTSVPTGPIFGFSALADNSAFATHLRSTGNLIGFKSYPDHHSYTQADIDKIVKLAGPSTVVCTQKDWVKVSKLVLNSNITYLPISISIYEGNSTFNQWLRSQIDAT